MKQMKNRTVGLVIGLMLAMLVGVVTAQKPETAPAMMEAAKQKAIVEGDLAGATKLYQAIVDRFAKTDRAAAAAALLEIAAIHQQTGNDSQSKLTLTQIVGQYADQRDVASVAQARLAQLKNVNASESSVRQTRTLVWSDTSVKRHLSAVVSPNGRFVGYSDQWAVYIDDLSSGATRRLVIPGTERAYAKQLAFANDAKSLFYTWRDSAARHDDVRVVQLSGTAVPEPQILFRNEDIPVVMHPASFTGIEAFRSPSSLSPMDRFGCSSRLIGRAPADWSSLLTADTSATTRPWATKTGSAIYSFWPSTAAASTLSLPVRSMMRWSIGLRTGSACCS
jgi:hypothetical protein